MSCTLDQLMHCFSAPLPGLNAQILLAPHYRIEETRNLAIPPNAVKSSVLLLFYHKQDICHIVLIRRPVYKGVHSGQIALPGGRWEQTDKNAYATAIRESEEEIGLDSASVSFLGKLTDLYIPPSNYLVSPFAAYYPAGIPRFKPDPHEVAAIIEVPFVWFTRKNAVKITTLNLSSGVAIQTPCFEFEGNIIWGATAMILSEMVEMWKSTV